MGNGEHKARISVYNDTQHYLSFNEMKMQGQLNVQPIRAISPRKYDTFEVVNKGPIQGQLSYLLNYNTSKKVDIDFVFDNENKVQIKVSPGIKEHVKTISIGDPKTSNKLIEVEIKIESINIY